MHSVYTLVSVAGFKSTVNHRYLVIRSSGTLLGLWGRQIKSRRGVCPHDHTVPVYFAVAVFKFFSPHLYRALKGGMHNIKVDRIKSYS